MYFTECIFQAGKISLKFVALNFLLNYFSFIGASRLLATFTAGGPIQNVLVLPDRFIVGATNNLYVVDAKNLSQLQHASLGPMVDSAYCNAELTSCVDRGRASLAETDNVNKILHFIPSLSASVSSPSSALVAGDESATRKERAGTLLVCGSTRQGTCELRDAQNIQRFMRRSTALRQAVVAANTQNASTVSLLDADYDRLYVAATYTHESPYREAFPAVATRLLSANLSPINAGAIDGEAAVVVRAEFRAAYRIHYVGAFTDETYVYFGSVQPRAVQTQMSSGGSGASLTNPSVSRLIRVCRNDDKYKSYSEIELQCRLADGKTKYNVLTAMILLQDNLFGVFTDADARQSSICIFEMSKIRLTFFYNIDRCRRGTDTVGLPHIGRDAKCFNRSNLPLAEDTCQLGVGGVFEASQLAAIQLPYVLTSIDAKIVEDHALVIAGTSRGEILQMEMSGEHSKRLEKYAQFAVGPDPVQRVHFLDERNFLAVSNKELILMKISTCRSATFSSLASPFSATHKSTAASSIDACASCLTERERDPLCGWCLANGRCSRQADCATFSLLKRCPRVARNEGLTPRNVSAAAFGDGKSSVFVAFQNLPPPANEKMAYECHFDIFKSTAKWSPDGLSCALPKRQLALSSASLVSPTTTQNVVESDESVVDFSIRVTSSARVELFHDALTVYNCAAYSVCSVCTTSRWACHWCASETKCQNADESCAETKGTSKCAKIDAERQTEILIPNATNSSISFTVLDLNEADFARSDERDSSNSALSCSILPKERIDRRDGSSSKNDRIRVDANLRNGRVRCANTFFSYTGAEPTRNYALELYMGRQLIDKTNMTVYKCGAMGADCSQCLALDPKYGCVWCDNACAYGSACRSNGTASRKSSNNNAALADQLCVRPLITTFRPDSAPLDGGTTVEILGSDLGSKMSDVQNRVHVAGALCRVVEYEVSRRIVCVLEKGSGDGPVRVTIGQAARRVAESSAHFHFRNPQAKSIYPVFGPLSGGTRLTIFGEHLRVGSNTTVHLDNLPCYVLNETESADQISCLTSTSRQEYTVTAIRVQIDNTIRMLHAKYTYRADPTVYGIEPSTSFETGGRMITVTGANLDAVMSARIFLLSSAEAPDADIVSDLSACQILNATLMKCASPRLRLPPALRQSAYGRWPVGFEMDGVNSLRNLAPYIQMNTVSDPQFVAFKGLKIQPYDQPLIIEGEYLALSANAEDYLITIGTETCTVYLLDNRQLLCRLSTDVEPLATDDTGAPIDGGHPLVVVRVGGLRVELGPIEIDNSGAGALLAARRVLTRLGALRTGALLLVVGVLVVVATALLLAARRRQINEHERAYKRIRLQIEHMESSVRNECKQAFAELQTDMLSDLASTLNDADIPYRRSAQFVSRLLFRDINNDENYRRVGYGDCLTLYSSHLPFALEQFGALLWNRQFVFLLVEWAETDAAITLTERSTLAALLISVLIRNFTYCTDVVLTLLSAHIQRVVMSKDAHLLFRRSESVVEKLFQHWLTISLLPYVTRSGGGNAGSGNVITAPGRHFYLLYKALKLQTEKGPVDFVTGQTRYSLSEQRLLRESVNATIVNLLVIPLEGFDQAPLSCRVLDCDTITQVKNKLLDLLYRNASFSGRITVNQFDLEWNSPRYGTVILLDDDAPEAKGDKRLNTVAYYKLPNNCMLTMQPSSVANSNHHSLTFQSDTTTTCSVRSARQLLSGNNNNNNNHASPASGSSGNSSSSPTTAMTTGTMTMGRIGGAAGFLPDTFFLDDTRYYHLTPPSARDTTSGAIKRGTLSFDANLKKNAKKKRRKTETKNINNNNSPHAHNNNNNKTNNYYDDGGYRSFYNAGVSFSSATTTDSDNCAPHSGASAIPEVFLTRLLMCKSAVLPYLENFFEAVMFAASAGDEIPIVARFIFQFLEEEASRNNVTNSEIVETWKMNALILRFWMQLIHNPDFVFDIQRHSAVDASLVVVGQTLVDACSQSEMSLSKESPSSKLLFAKEIARYRPLARETFRNVTQTSNPKTTVQQFQEFILSMHQPLCDEIDAGSAVGELLAWVKSRGIGVADVLERDVYSVKYGIFQRFRQIVDYVPQHQQQQQDAQEHFYASIK